MPSTNNDPGTDDREPYYYLAHNTADGVNIQIGDKIASIYKPWEVTLPMKNQLDLEVQAYGRKLISLG